MSQNTYSVFFKKKEETASNYNVYAICWVVADLKKKELNEHI